MSESTKKAATAATAEVTGDDTIDIVWHDHTFTIPASADHWSIDAMTAFTTLVDTSSAGEVGTFRHIAGFLGEILGQAQWTRVRKGTHNKAADASDLFTTVMASYGELKPGE